MQFNLKLDEPVRYLRLPSSPERITEIEGYFQGKKLDRTAWRASNLFPSYYRNRPTMAWSYNYTADEIAPGSYLAVVINGRHGREGAYAALRVDGQLVGAPDRRLSYPSNAWEVPVRPMDSNYTYYFPLTSDMVGKKIEVVVLGMHKELTDLKPEVWQTAYGAPYVSQELVLTK